MSRGNLQGGIYNHLTIYLFALRHDFGVLLVRTLVNSESIFTIIESCDSTNIVYDTVLQFAAKVPVYLITHGLQLMLRVIVSMCKLAVLE